jgi:hypothetical protein
VEIGKELGVDEVAEIVAGLRFVVVDLAVFVFGRGPFFPAVGFVEDEGVFLALQAGFVGFVQAWSLLPNSGPGAVLPPGTPPLLHPAG